MFSLGVAMSVPRQLLAISLLLLPTAFFLSPESNELLVNILKGMKP
jgi:hypothetical protein